MTTANKRARQKMNRASAGRHTGLDHRHVPDPEHPGHRITERCFTCRPLPLTPEQRAAAAARRLADLPAPAWMGILGLGRGKKP